MLSTPFFVALYQALKFLTYIDKNKAFSNKSIKALRNIKICATIFSVLVVVALVVGISVAKNMDPNEDVTGFVTLGFVFTFILRPGLLPPGFNRRFCRGVSAGFRSRGKL